MKYTVRILFSAAILMVAGFTVASILYGRLPPNNQAMLTQPENQVAGVSYCFNGKSVTLDMTKDQAVVHKIYSSIKSTGTRKVYITADIGYAMSDPLIIVVIEYKNGKEDVIESDHSGKELYRPVNIGTPVYPQQVRLQAYAEKDYYTEVGGNTALLQMFHSDSKLGEWTLPGAAASDSVAG